MPPVRPHPANGALVSAGPCRCRKLCRPCDLGISWMSPPRRLRRTTRRLVGGAGGAGSGTEPSGASHPTHGGVDAGGSAPHRRPAPPQATAAPRSAADPANSPNTEGSPLDNLAAEARVAEVDGWPRASNSAALQLDAVGAGGVAVALDGELVASLLRQGEQALVVEAAADAQRLLLEERLLIRCRCGQRPGQGAVGGTLLHVQVDLLALTAGKSVLVLGSRRLDVAGALVGPVLLDDVADLDATLLGGGYRPEPEAVGAGGVAVALDGELVASLLRQGEQALVVEAAADAQRLLLEERLLIRCRCGQRPGQGAVGGTLLHVQVDLLALTGGKGVAVDRAGSRKFPEHRQRPVGGLTATEELEQQHDDERHGRHASAKQHRPPAEQQHLVEQMPARRRWRRCGLACRHLARCSTTPSADSSPGARVLLLGLLLGLRIELPLGLRLGEGVVQHLQQPTGVKLEPAGAEL